MNDLISRQAAIDALGEAPKYKQSIIKTYAEGRNDQWFDDVTKLTLIPSAQPDPCVDTIDALNESIKHFDDMAEECRRNANIERNDYMDMRDDAAEYRQLSTWLNELRWLRERFQSQPQRKKGKWIPVTNGRGGFECNQCHCYAPSYQDGVEWLSAFCPNCGAMMIEGESE